MEPTNATVSRPPTTSTEFSIGNANEEDWSDCDPVAGPELSSPEEIEEWQSFPSRPPPALVPKGAFGAMVRAIKSIPPCVWVINQHTEEITVVVSRQRPSRMFAGAGINLSPTGGGVNFDTSTFLGPATKKVLAPKSGDDEKSRAVFPLWTRRDGFGVISVFTGPNKELYIENDRIPAGATACFLNTPDMKVFKYDGSRCE